MRVTERAIGQRQATRQTRKPSPLLFPWPVSPQNLTQKGLLRYAAMAARWHEPPKDALDRLVLESADLQVRWPTPLTPSQGRAWGWILTSDFWLMHRFLPVEWRVLTFDRCPSPFPQALDNEKIVQTAYMPFDPVVKRTEGTVRTVDGESFKVRPSPPPPSTDLHRHPTTHPTL